MEARKEVQSQSLMIAIGGKKFGKSADYLRVAIFFVQTFDLRSGASRLRTLKLELTSPLIFP